MKRLVLVLLVLLMAFSLSAQLKFSGSTGATVYHDDGKVGVVDADQDVTLGLGPLLLALNAGYTYDFAAISHAISFGYTLSATQAVGPFTFAGSVASDGLKIPIGGVLAGNPVGAINASAAIAKDALSVKAVGVFSGVKAGPFFRGVDLSATYAPKFGSFTVGGAFTDAAADAVGAMVADVEGLSFYAKAKVSY